MSCSIQVVATLSVANGTGRICRSTLAAALIFGGGTKPPLRIAAADAARLDVRSRTLSPRTLPVGLANANSSSHIMHHSILYFLVRDVTSQLISTLPFKAWTTSLATRLKGNSIPLVTSHPHVTGEVGGRMTSSIPSLPGGPLEVREAPPLRSGTALWGSHG